MGLLSGRHQSPTADGHDHQAGGVLLDRGWRYDAEVWLFDTFVMRGQIRRLRQKVLELAQLDAGSRLLDVGCGTGTLAIQAARLTRPNGQVAGIDPAPRQIARAQSKARRAGLDIDFRRAAIEQLPFDDQSFDAVTSTLMMHHLPDDVKAKGLNEIHRVLKPQGRLVIADFDTSEDATHHRSDGDGAESLFELIARAGLTDTSNVPIPFSRQHHGWSGATLTRATRP